MKANTFDKSFTEQTHTFASHIAHLSRMVVATSERLLYIELLTRGFRSTPKYSFQLTILKASIAHPYLLILMELRNICRCRKLAKQSVKYIKMPSCNRIDPLSF